MFGDKLREIFDSLGSKHFVTEETIDDVSKEIQKALIMADVDVSLVFELSKKIKALKGEKAPEGADPKEYLVKRVYDLLSGLFGSASEIPQVPKRILLCGLFGSGKTTSACKIANFYKRKKLDVGIIAADTYRMAAYEQLKQYAINFNVFGNVSKTAGETVKQGLKHFKDKNTIIVDTAGRSALDSELAKELKEVKEVLQPDLSILVISADLGQIALKQAKEFNEIVGLNGIIITKMDGSAKGGGALAACAHLQIPVLFIGSGEKIEDLQVFDSIRYLSQIMGYPDLQGLLEKVNSLEEGEFEPPETLDFTTFKKQLKMAGKLGGLTKIAKMLGFGKYVNDELSGVAETKFKAFSAMIDSMTPYERTHPDCLSTSRLNRIAKGSGTKLEDTRLLMKQYNMMQEAFGKMKNAKEQSFNPKDLEKMMQKQAQKKMKKKFKLK